MERMILILLLLGLAPVSLALNSNNCSDQDVKISTCSADVKLSEKKHRGNDTIINTDTEIKFYTKPKTICECIKTVNQDLSDKIKCADRKAQNLEMKYQVKWFYDSPEDKSKIIKQHIDVSKGPFEGRTEFIKKDCNS